MAEHGRSGLLLSDVPGSAPAQRRHLSDLLRGGSDGPVLADEGKLRQAVAAGDPLLYQAYRDVHVRAVEADRPDGFCWRADLVEYAEGVLADGQPVRSVGHWNHPEQIEVFQVLAGQVVMLIGSDAGGGFLAMGVYAAGDLAVVPPGWFHLTCSPWQASTVYNIYTDRDPAGQDRDKYRRRRPLPYVVVVEGDTPVLMRPSADGGQGRTAAAVAGQLCVPGLTAPGETLHQLMAIGTPARLRELRDRIATACAAGWPAGRSGRR